MIAFIDDQREACGVEPICKVLPSAPATYRPHAARRADPGLLPARARSDAALMIEIRRVFEENFRVYGVRKVWHQVGREGIAVARRMVARLVWVMGLQGIVRGRKVRTTIPDNALAETINGLFKAEVIHRCGPWWSFEAVEFATLEWVDWFSTRRLLESIGNVPPAEAEARCFAQAKVQALA